MGIEINMTGQNSSDKGGSGSLDNKELDRLIDTFINQLDSNEKQQVIDRLEEKNPNAAKILQNVWDMERSGERSKELVDDIIDALS